MHSQIHPQTLSPKPWLKGFGCAGPETLEVLAINPQTQMLLGLGFMGLGVLVLNRVPGAQNLEENPERYYTEMRSKVLPGDW